MMNHLRALAGARNDDGAGILEMLPRLMGGFPEGDRIRLEELHELLVGSELVGPTSPPSWALAFFRVAELEHGVSAELLAAVSWSFTRYAPDNPGGLLALPETIRGGRAVHATPAELRDRDPAAIERVKLGVVEGARWLAARRSSTASGLATVLVDYASYAAPEDRYPDPRAAAYDVAHTFVLYLARRARGSRLERGLAAMVTPPPTDPDPA